MRGNGHDTSAEHTPTGLVGGAGGAVGTATYGGSAPDGTGAAEDQAGAAEGQAGAAQEAGGTVHRPPYQAGPSGGDNHTVTKTNRQTGSVTVLEHNTRQAAFVHCIGNGPMAMLEVRHRVSQPVSSVQIHYAKADLTNAVVMNVIVTGSSSGWLGHGATLGQSLNEADPSDRTGTINIPLHGTPEKGETLRIQFGLQTHAGCLPYPVLGLPGSRTVESGRVTFPWVSVG